MILTSKITPGSSNNNSRASAATPPFNAPTPKVNRLPLKKRPDHQLTLLHDSQKIRSKKQNSHTPLNGNDHGNNQEHPALHIANLASTNAYRKRSDSTSRRRYSKRKQARSTPVAKRATKKRKQTRTTNSSTTKQKEQALTTGRWSADECKAFLRGLKEHGKGKWSKIAKGIPTRDTVQVKTHAQCSLKKLDQGEDIFAILDLIIEPKPESRPDPVLSPSHSSQEIDEYECIEDDDKHKCTESNFGLVPSLSTFRSSSGLIDLTFDAAVHAAQNAIDGDCSMMNISPLTLLRGIDSRNTLPTVGTVYRPFSIQTPVPNIFVATCATATVTDTPKNGKENKILNGRGDDDLSSAAKILLELSSPASSAVRGSFADMNAATVDEEPNAHASDASRNRFDPGHFYCSAYSPVKRIVSL